MLGRTASPEDHQAARQFLTDNTDPDLTALLAALQAIYGDGITVGTSSAAEQTGTVVTGSLIDPLPATGSTPATTLDWAAWQPGNAAAQAILTDGTWTELLDQAGIVIKGISQSVLDQMGTALADGVAAGDSVDTITKTLTDVLEDPNRAYMIALTETNRAVTAASMRTYQQNGVPRWELLTSPDACDICVAIADGGPYDVGDGDPPPEHPRCECSCSPVTPAL
jgi:SPP1 gp7 family putative phage head morphogenesis protein